MTVEYLKFINLQYFFCLVYSLFGGKCAEPPKVDVSLSGGASVGTTTIDGVNGTLASGTAELPNPALTPDLTPIGGLFHSISETVLFTGQVIVSAIAFLWAIYSAVAYTVSGLLFMVILSSLSGLVILRYRELALYGSLPRTHTGTKPARSRWQELLGHAMSTEPKRWRSGIMDADKMLGELLSKLGYVGKTTADQMQIVGEGAFVTLPAAWEAHRIRNFVAAKSSSYILTQREAFRVMKLYEEVFEEFDFI